MDSFKPRRALISVANKQGVVAFAQELHSLGIELISTGGTAKLLKEQQIPVQEVADYTGFPEILGGRVKTLHPKIHAGILARRGVDESVLTEHHIPTIDLVVVNLYPFADTIAQTDCTFEQAIEQIDIGGPCLLRAAAKNHTAVGVVVHPKDYDTVLKEIRDNQTLGVQTRQQLACKAFAHTANYDSAIANYLQPHNDPFPPILNLTLTKQRTLRYGENPHQSAALYHLNDATQALQQLQGKPLSYNNLVDSDAAMQCVDTLAQAACVIVKHATPCGVALGDTPTQAYQRAYQTDPSACFGGIIAFNRPITIETAQLIITQQFVEVIIAPAVDNDALTQFNTKPNIRVLTYQQPITTQLDYQSSCAGLLIQQSDNTPLDPTALTVVSNRHPNDAELVDLHFAWHVVKYVKSNAIVLAKQQATLGIGTGQTSRVLSTHVACMQAQQNQFELTGSVLASDAFLPFPDTCEIAAKAGVSAIIQPGGSIRDAAVIDAANHYNLAMIFTGMRHFRH